MKIIAESPHSWQKGHYSQEYGKPLVWLFQSLSTLLSALLRLRARCLWPTDLHRASWPAPLSSPRHRSRPSCSPCQWSSGRCGRASWVPLCFPQGADCTPLDGTWTWTCSTREGHGEGRSQCPRDTGPLLPYHTLGHPHTATNQGDVVTWKTGEDLVTNAATQFTISIVFIALWAIPEWSIVQSYLITIGKEMTQLCSLITIFLCHDGITRAQSIVIYGVSTVQPKAKFGCDFTAGLIQRQGNPDTKS